MAPFVRAAIRADRAAEGIARRRDQAWRATTGYAIVDLGADLEGEARQRRRRSRPNSHCRRARAGKARRYPIGRRTYRDPCAAMAAAGPNQEYALALASLLNNTSGISALAADNRRRRRRRRQRDPIPPAR